MAVATITLDKYAGFTACWRQDYSEMSAMKCGSRRRVLAFVLLQADLTTRARLEANGGKCIWRPRRIRERSLRVLTGQDGASARLCTRARACSFARLLSRHAGGVSGTGWRPGAVYLH